MLPPSSALAARRAFLQFRCLKSSLSISASDVIASNLRLWPEFFSKKEQVQLLTAGLGFLDSQESRRYKRLREKLERPALSEESTVQEVFYPDNCYNFEQGHYDAVIHDYREKVVEAGAQTLEKYSHGVSELFQRLKTLYPSQDTQMHVLHLASSGEILPHVDNIEASGSWILGISLGSPRVMRLERQGEEPYEVELPSGSVYLQKDDVRFKYKHSILKARAPLEDGNVNQQRLSIMVRDRLHA
jgi:alkylated DNA repair protein alkB family protein 7